MNKETKTLSDNDVREMIQKFDFYCKKHSWSEKWHNESGNFKNDFEDNGDGTVTDYATGLMWQQSGSDNYMEYKDTPIYVKKINQEKLAGYGDWRIPSIEELASLLESEEKNGDLYIDPVFDKKQRWCWSSNKRLGDGVWVVYFSGGDVYWHYEFFGSYVRLVRRVQ